MTVRGTKSRAVALSLVLFLIIITTCVVRRMTASAYSTCRQRSVALFAAGSAVRTTAFDANVWYVTVGFGVSVQLAPHALHNMFTLALVALFGLRCFVI